MNQAKQTKPLYRFAPVTKLATLARVLGISQEKLLHLCSQADHLYQAREEPKTGGGGFRTIVNAHPSLKLIQGRIKAVFLDRVDYPHYLMGGIRDKIFPRDYKRNAAIHSGAAILIREDIQSFFPSIKSHHVFAIWRDFFRFSDEVSECLTKLTIRYDELPQGARTSNHLSNLVLWKCEPELYVHLTALGLRYSRLIDDMIVSSPCRRLDRSEIAAIVARIYAMLGRYGFKAKRAKHGIESPAGRMTVNKVVVNRRPSLTREKQSAVRAAVRKCETTPANLHKTPAYRKLFLSALGHVGTIKRFHPQDGERLQNRLNAVRPG